MDGPIHTPSRARHAVLPTTASLLAAWALFYARYRGYYAFGGRFGITGRLIVG